MQNTNTNIDSLIFGRYHSHYYPHYYNYEGTPGRGGFLLIVLAAFGATIAILEARRSRN